MAEPIHRHGNFCRRRARDRPDKYCGGKGKNEFGQDFHKMIQPKCFRKAGVTISPIMVMLSRQNEVGNGYSAGLPLLI
ncbi:MAG: hypothetical protein NTZ16_12790 [Verrucomicrobia bacterium]|nr:hypothetical protein [Verrucomicrobiota bacterium]